MGSTLSQLLQWKCTMHSTTNRKRVELARVTKENLKDSQWLRQFKAMLLDMREHFTSTTLSNSELINGGYYAINAISGNTEERTFIGFVQICPLTDFRDAKIVKMIYISQEYRGIGYGTVAYGVLLEMLKKERTKIVSTNVLHKNAAALALCRSYGYTIIENVYMSKPRTDAVWSSAPEGYFFGVSKLRYRQLLTVLDTFYKQHQKEMPPKEVREPGIQTELLNHMLYSWDAVGKPSSICYLTENDKFSYKYGNITYPIATSAKTMEKLLVVALNWSKFKQYYPVYIYTGHDNAYRSVIEKHGTIHGYRLMLKL